MKIAIWVSIILIICVCFVGAQDPKLLETKPDTIQEQNDLSPILGENAVLYIAAGVLFMIISFGVCFAITLKKDPALVKEFRGGRVLHILTVMNVVLATVVLGLERILNGEAIAGILGGIIGYVLGSLKPGDISYPIASKENPTDKKSDESNLTENKQ